MVTRLFFWREWKWCTGFVRRKLIILNGKQNSSGGTKVNLASECRRYLLYKWLGISFPDFWVKRVNVLCNSSGVVSTHTNKGQEVVQVSPDTVVMVSARQRHLRGAAGEKTFDLFFTRSCWSTKDLVTTLSWVRSITYLNKHYQRTHTCSNRLLVCCCKNCRKSTHQALCLLHSSWPFQMLLYSATYRFELREPRSHLEYPTKCREVFLKLPPTHMNDVLRHHVPDLDAPLKWIVNSNNSQRVSFIRFLFSHVVSPTLAM